MSTLISFNKDNFADFMNVLSIIKGSSDVCIIKNGFLRQKNRNRTFVIQADLTKLVENNDLFMVVLDYKYNLLDPFKKRKVDVKLEIVDKLYEFKDEHTKVSFFKPVESIIEKEYVTKENYDKIFNLSDDNKILDIKIKDFILERLSSYQKTLGANNILLEFKGTDIVFSLSPPTDDKKKNKKNQAFIELLRTENTANIQTGWIACPIYPLLIDTEEVSFRMHNVDLNGTKALAISVDSVIGKSKINLETKIIANVMEQEN